LKALKLSVDVVNQPFKGLVMDSLRWLMQMRMMNK